MAVFFYSVNLGERLQDFVAVSKPVRLPIRKED
jgi:hypothetical protein